jgi:Flp pilus assembly protein CpaB
MLQRKHLIFSILAGVAAALCAMLFLWGQAQAAARTHDEIIEGFRGGAVKVMVARERLASGTVLDRRMFEEQTWPGFCLPEGVIEAEDFTRFEGCRSMATIVRGEALVRSRVLDRQLPTDRLSEGMTALTLPTDNVHALGGELVRGMHLTLMVTLADGRVSELAHRVEVLSANTASFQSESADEGEGSSVSDARLALSGGSGGRGIDVLNWVTLAVPHEQVKQILTASRLGTINFVLPKEALSFDTDELPTSTESGE